MTSTKSSPEERGSFRRVFWWSMGYNRIVTGFYTLFLLGALPVGVLLSIITNQSYYSDPNNWAESTPAEVAGYYAEAIRQSFNIQLTSLVLPLAVLFLLVWCARNFSYMQGRRSVDLFHALPVRRTPLLLGNYAAGLASTLLPIALSVGVTELLCSLHHLQGVMANPLLYWEAFTVMALPLTAAMTLTVFFMVVSGNALNWSLMTAATALGWPVAVLCADQTMRAFLPGYVSAIPATLYTALCPYLAAYAIIPNGFSYLLFSLSDERAPLSSPELYTVPAAYLLWWAFFSAALLALTVFYYRRRRSECAENPFSFPAARGAVRSLVTIDGALALGLMVGTLMNSNLGYAIALGVGAVTAHTVYQGVITRGFQRFWRTIPAFALTSALIVGGLYTLYSGGLGYVSRIPAAADVVKLEVTLPGVAGDESKEAYLSENSFYSLGLLNQKGEWVNSVSPVFERTEDVEALCALHQAALRRYPGPYLPYEKTTDYSASRTLTLTYTLKNGRTLSRNYEDLPFYRDDEALLGALAAVQKLETVQSYIPLYSTQSKRLTSASVYEDDGHVSYSADNSRLSAEEKERLWSTFVEELNSAQFRYPSTLRTEQESLELLKKEGDSSEEMENSAAERSYNLCVGRIPAAELDPGTAALLTRDELAVDPEGLPVVLAGVDGGSYTVPACCVKTRALIDELTEPYGEYTNYEEAEQDEEGIVSPADESWDEGWDADWSADGSASGTLTPRG